MSIYYGLIIPRSYNDYINKSQPAEFRKAMDNTGLIPNTASEDNQLADKNFVNSTVGTNTANYIYKTDASGENVPFDSIAELEAYAGTVTQNDYAFVTGIDENGNRYYDRYKANETDGVITWGKEYRLNNSSFTAEQWAAIESGITSELVELFKAGAVPAVDEIKDGELAPPTSNAVAHLQELLIGDTTNIDNFKNNYTTTQLYEAGENDAPLISGSNYLITKTIKWNRGYEIAHPANFIGDMFIRRFIAGNAWSSWDKIVTSNDIGNFKLTPLTVTEGVSNDLVCYINEATRMGFIMGQFRNPPVTSDGWMKLAGLPKSSKFNVLFGIPIRVTAGTNLTLDGLITGNEFRVYFFEAYKNNTYRVSPTYFYF